MAMTPEAKVKKQIASILETMAKSNTLLRVPIVMGAMMKRGTSDILVCRAGMFVAIEAKATEDSFLTANQADFLRKVRNAGGVPMVVHGQNVKFLDDFMLAAPAKGSPSDSPDFLRGAYAYRARLEDNEKVLGQTFRPLMDATRLFASWAWPYDECLKPLYIWGKAI